jgi:hypothetical protein
MYISSPQSWVGVHVTLETSSTFSPSSLFAVVLFGSSRRLSYLSLSFPLRLVLFSENISWHEGLPNIHSKNIEGASWSIAVYYKLVFLTTGNGPLCVLFGGPLRHPFPCCSASAGLAADRRANNFGTSRPKSRSRIHERTVSLRCLGIILRVLKLEVSVYNGHNYKPVSTHNLLGVRGGGWVKFVNRDDCK